jgi:hypothetical protein
MNYIQFNPFTHSLLSSNRTINGRSKINQMAGTAVEAKFGLDRRSGQYHIRRPSVKQLFAEPARVQMASFA